MVATVSILESAAGEENAIFEIISLSFDWSKAIFRLEPNKAVS